MAGRPVDKALQCLVEAERMLDEAGDAFRRATEADDFSSIEGQEAYDRLDSISSTAGRLLDLANERVT